MFFTGISLFTITCWTKATLTCASCSSVKFLLLVWAHCGRRDIIASVRGQHTSSGFPVVQYAAARIIVTVGADDTTHLPGCFHKVCHKALAAVPCATTVPQRHLADVRLVHIRVITALWIYNKSITEYIRDVTKHNRGHRAFILRWATYQITVVKVFFSGLMFECSGYS